jgi:folate-binding protein YgfZ
VPRHTGDVTPDPAAIDADARDHVIVEGPDALTYLHSQIAQDIRDLAIGKSQWTLVLEPTGKVESLARVTRTGDDVFDFDTDAGFGEPLLARLSRFKIRVKAEITVVRAASAEPSAAHEGARVAAGWPRMGFEIVPGETIPAVTGVVPVAVNFTKGCYPGQELVERMDSRGADAPRSLRVVEVADGARVGDSLTDSDGADVGTLTSVSPFGDLALASVKRGHDVGRLPAHLC